eukprot:12188937-Prorocentrum_lima.AAC.1
MTWYRPKWDGLDANGNPGQQFTDYVEEVQRSEQKGGLLQLNAACSAYRLQALVYDTARNCYIL